jgi:hypothetical protein
MVKRMDPERRLRGEEEGTSSREEGREEEEKEGRVDCQ